MVCSPPPGLQTARGPVYHIASNRNPNSPKQVTNELLSDGVVSIRPSLSALAVGPSVGPQLCCSAGGALTSFPRCLEGLATVCHTNGLACGAVPQRSTVLNYSALLQYFFTPKYFRVSKLVHSQLDCEHGAVAKRSAVHSKVAIQSEDSGGLGIRGFGGLLQYSTAAQQRTAQRSAVQHSTAQQREAQRSAARRSA